jgi:hypothetical protein
MQGRDLPSKAAPWSSRCHRSPAVRKECTAWVCKPVSLTSAASAFQYVSLTHPATAWRYALPPLVATQHLHMPVSTSLVTLPSWSMLVLPTRGRSNKRAWAIRHVPNCIAQLL